MAVKPFVKVTYDDTLTEIRSVESVVDYISPVVVPLVALINGGKNNAPNMSVGKVTARKHEWQQKALRPASTLLTAGLDNSETTLGVTAADGLHLTKGTEITVDSEKMLVTTAGTAAGVVVVARAQGGTSGAAHDSGATVVITGRAHEEGTAAPTDSYTTVTQPYNYVQEFVEQLSASDIEMGIARYGSMVEELGGGKKNITNVIKMLEMEAQIKNLINLELQCIYGKAVVASSGVPARFNGVLEYMASANKTDLNGASVTAKDVNDLMETIFSAAGGESAPDIIMTNGRGKRILTALFGNTVTPGTVEDAKYGGLRVDYITTDFGDLGVVANVRYPHRMDFLRADALQLLALDNNEFRSIPLGRTGTFESWMVTGAYTLEMRKDVCHGTIYDYDTNLPV